VYPLLALTIDNSTLFIVAGTAAIIVTVFMGITTQLGKWIAVGGAVLLCIGFLAKNPGGTPVPPSPPAPYPPTPYPPNPTPNPTPDPNPQPYPPPTPPTPPTFAEGVVLAFKADNGTADDAVILSAMFGQFSATLEYDGRQSQPRIVTSNDLGNGFARMQQYRFLSPTTIIRQKFPNLQAYVVAEMKRIGLTDGVLDQTKRSNGVLMYQAVSNALKVEIR
jgi:hypothetical protein